MIAPSSKFQALRNFYESKSIECMTVDKFSVTGSNSKESPQIFYSNINSSNMNKLIIEKSLNANKNNENNLSKIVHDESCKITSNLFRSVDSNFYSKNVFINSTIPCRNQNTGYKNIFSKIAGIAANIKGIFTCNFTDKKVSEKEQKKQPFEELQEFWEKNGIIIKLGIPPKKLWMNKCMLF